jgi:hypothetical protein
MGASSLTERITYARFMGLKKENRRTSNFHVAQPKRIRRLAKLP